MKKVIIIFSVFLLLTSCYTTTFVPDGIDYNAEMVRVLDSVFVGKSYGDIADEFSAPDRLLPDGKEGQIMIYENTTYQTKAITYYGNSALSYTKEATTGKKFYLNFYVDSCMICYKVKTNYGEGIITGENKKVKSKGRTLGLSLGLGIGIPILAGMIAGMIIQSK